MRLKVTLAALVFALAALAAACDTDDPAPSLQRSSPPPPPPASEQLVQRAAEVLNVVISTEAAAPTSCAGGTTQQLTVTGRDIEGSGEYAFDAKDFAFSTGDCVEFTFAAETEFHTFTVEDLGLDQSADGGENVTFAFTFSEPGQFALICIPHQDQGMVGTITVQ